MGGGGSSGATPTTPPGYTGGSVMNYTPPLYSPSPMQGGGFDYGALGNTFQQFGQSIANQPTPNYMSGSSNIAPANIPGGAPQTNMIPVTAQDTTMIEALMRLLGGLG